jgi:hypothetical protein
MEDSIFGLNLAINESRDFLNKQIESIEAFKRHQGRILTSLSLIISMLGLIFGLQPEPLDKITSMLLTATGGLFLVFVFIYAFLIKPVALQTPLEVDFDNFEDILFNKPPKETLENLLENLIDVVKINKQTIDRFDSWSLVSTIIFLVSVAFSLVLVICLIW